MPADQMDAEAASRALLRSAVVSVNVVSSGVCGHPGIVHGGLTAALIDETCGYLLYIIRHRGMLDFQAVVTASLEVSYKQPLVPDHPVVVTAWVAERSGRKIWVHVTVADAPTPTANLLGANLSTPSLAALASNGVASSGAGGVGSEAGSSTQEATATNHGRVVEVATSDQGTSVGIGQLGEGDSDDQGGRSADAIGCTVASNRVYATAKALFIIPRPESSSNALLQAQEAAAAQHLGPRGRANQEASQGGRRSYVTLARGNPVDV